MGANLTCNGTKTAFISDWPRAIRAAWASLETCAEDEAIACFEEALRSNRYGACFIDWAEVHRSKESAHSGFSVHLCARWNRDFCANGTARIGSLLRPNRRAVGSGFPIRLINNCNCREIEIVAATAASSVYNKILMRARERKQKIERISWRSRTDKAEFTRVMTWLWEAQWLRFPTQQRKFASVSLQSCFPTLSELRAAPDSPQALLGRRAFSASPA